VLDSGTTLRFHDPRRFGAILWVPPPAARIRCWRPSVRAVRRGVRRGYLWRATRRRKAAIKLALMDNRLVVGVGKHLRERVAVPCRNSSDDAGPARFAGAARKAPGRDPRDAGRRDRKGGSTLRDYVDSQGEPGYFQLDYYVYGREGLPAGFAALQ
jgi:formamidopyrimidine-DNA glycosylase